MADLARTIYLSVPRHPVDSMILDIVRSSERRNQRLKVSGMLLYNDFFFCQLLEGAPERLDELCEMIFADPRHTLLSSVNLPAIRREIGIALPLGYARCPLPLSDPSAFEGAATGIAAYLVEIANQVYPNNGQN